MESPVVVDKPPEYHGRPANDRGFPFDEEDGSGAWSELASRHPDIAARLRQRPASATWARKRRPNSQDQEDFGDGFSRFDRFPFDDIPPEFREHFPTHWNRREREQQPHSPQPQQPPPQPHQQTTATQTEDTPVPQEEQIPQYGLRNTVDLGQKSPADPSLVDAEDRSQRSMSAPPETNANMSAPNHDQPRAEQHPSNVRVIPILVEGRDQPVINKNVDHGTHFGEAKPAHVPPQPHIDREQYFADEGPIGYVPPPNFSRSFGSPYGKFRQGPQPFVHQKVYPQSATSFARGASPQRSQSPKPHPQEEHYVKVPVHHEPPRPEQRQQRPQQPTPQQQQQQYQQQQQQQYQQQQQQQQEAPQPKPQPPPSNDPITQILAVQTDVLNLMSDVENFKGNKKDKHYIYLDEMLTRNLIKLDTIETEGKENIRQARREAIKCIQKCIAVLEAKASEESNKANAAANAAAQENTQEVEMKEEDKPAESAPQNGEVEMKEPKEETKESQAEAEKSEQPQEKQEPPTIVEPEAQPTENKEPQVDTRPEPKAETEKKSPKKGKGKKRDKSKDKKEVGTEAMQVDDKGDKQETMEVEATSQ